MCGIIGYKGENNPVNILIEGLRNLEYRGYDSAGIAIMNNKRIQIIKSVGKISDLEELLTKADLINSNMGIGHTRWATHGGVNVNNAHPHKVGKVTLVHNGIIENASELREHLIHEGVKFNSDTDTEVACAIINMHYHGDAIEAINKALLEFRGSYAFCIMFEGIDKLYAVRKDSPLIVGFNDNEFYVSSDSSAIIGYTNKYFLLEKNEICEIDDEISVTLNGKKVKKEILISNIEADSKDKCGYDHFMLKEIMEEPNVLEKIVSRYSNDLSLLPDLNEYEEIHIVACGSAMYAGMIGKCLLEENTNLRVSCEVASEYRYRKIVYDRKTLVILVSQSGETADTIAAMRKAKLAGIDTLAIVNVYDSTIARESKMQVFIEAGVEVAVATTKAYMLQVAILLLLSYKASLKYNSDNINLLDEIKFLPELVKNILERRDVYYNVALDIYNNDHLFFIGRKIDYAVSLEGSLKLKEVSYIHSDAYQAGELKHGTISLIDDGTPVIAIVTNDDIFEKTISNVEEVKARGAKCIVISNRNVNIDCCTIQVPMVNKFIQPLLIVPCLQLIAYEVAKLRECDIDKPKNLAKSVTVE